MEHDTLVMRCPNCGEPWRADDEIPPDADVDRAASHRCSVCEFVFIPGSTGRPSSVEDLEGSISVLINKARQGGVPADEIVQILREELAFMAEYARQGRRLSVQIIDLGPQDGSASVGSNRMDGREALLDRGHAPITVN